jgi:hypothetical protein
MTEELKPCLFCGSPSGGAVIERSFSPLTPALQRRAVLCGDCGAEAMDYPDRTGAIAAWNRRADGWISVAERLPKVHDDVILMCVGRTQATSGYLDGDGEWYVYQDAYMGAGFVAAEMVTHWMPLPAAPKDGDA